MEKEKKIELPEAFVKKMEKLLGSDAGPFFESYDAERKFGLRINPLKRENVWMAEAGTRDAIRFMRQGHTIFRNQVPCPQRRH